MSDPTPEQIEAVRRALSEYDQQCAQLREVRQHKNRAHYELRKATEQACGHPLPMLVVRSWLAEQEKRE